MKINEDVRKVMLAGVGALSALTEKTQETLDTLAKKGEEALEHGQTINERLRHKIKQVMEDEGEPEKKAGKADVLDAMEHMTAAELNEVKEKLKSLGHDGE